MLVKSLSSVALKLTSKKAFSSNPASAFNSVNQGGALSFSSVENEAVTMLLENVGV